MNIPWNLLQVCIQYLVIDSWGRCYIIIMDHFMEQRPNTWGPYLKPFGHMLLDTYSTMLLLFTSPPEGIGGIVFILSVCVSVCPANILVFYLSDIRRDIDLKCIQVTYIGLYSIHSKIDIYRSKVKVTGTVHCFLNVQSYHHKN